MSLKPCWPEPMLDMVHHPLELDTAFSNPQPAQRFDQGGSPNSILQNAPPLTRATMNHFDIANWYDGRQQQHIRC